MLTPESRISFADLSAAGVRLRPLETVTIVRELVLQVAHGELPGVPSAHVIRFSASGHVSVEGPVSAGGRDVSRAAHLLEALLPGFDAPPELRVPGALRLIVARALGTLDLPPYPSLESFAEAMSRFGAADSDTVVRDLVLGWASAVEAQQAEGREGPQQDDSPDVPGEVFDRARDTPRAAGVRADEAGAPGARNAGGVGAHDL